MSIFSFISRSFSRRRAALLPRGFTLIELIVVSAIILIITAFILLQQDRFNSSTLLRSLSYSVALSVRQAQVYGTSVRGFTPTGGVETFASGYGVHFSPGVVDQYTLFADLPEGSGAGNGRLDATETLTNFTLGRGYRISKLCVMLVGGSTQACTSGTAQTITELGIYFRRPNTDACFTTDLGAGACVAGAAGLYSNAYVQLQSSGNGTTRSVKVSTTGQISVCAPNLTDLSTC